MQINLVWGVIKDKKSGQSQGLWSSFIFACLPGCIHHLLSCRWCLCKCSQRSSRAKPRPSPHPGKAAASHTGTRWLPAAAKGQDLKTHAHGDVGASRINFQAPSTQCGSKALLRYLHPLHTAWPCGVSSERQGSVSLSPCSCGLDDNLIRWDGKQRRKVWPCMASTKATRWISLSPHANSGLSGFYIYQRQVYPFL